MGIYRGIGGTGDSTSDANYAAVAAKAVEAATSATNAATSASSASSSASSAQGYATSASSSATAAASSATSAESAKDAAVTAKIAAELAETHAETAETNAETAEANAETAQAAAEAAQAAAETAQTAAAASASDAATSEANALQYASDAADSNTDAENHASAAATSATASATSATNAATSATNAATSASTANAAKDAALAALDSFDDRYLGAKATDPSLDNDGNALVPGALYYNTTDDVMKVYEGSLWVAAYASLSGALLAANNLSDLASASAARTNLGVTATGADTTYAYRANNLSDLASASTARTNLGLGTAATTAASAYATAAQGAKADSALQINPALGSPTSGNFSTGTFTWPTFNQNTTGNAATATTATNVSGGTASVTTLTTSSTVTFNGGTANGVGYLNGSKVLTTGSALTFDGTSLGIGVTPTQRLTVGGSADAQMTLRSSTTTGSGEIYFGDSDAVFRGLISYAHTDDSMKFSTSATEGMRLTSTGLGIGTSSPATKLQVNGNAVIGNGTVGAPASGYQLRITNDGSDYYDFGRSSSTGYFTINASQASPYRGFIWAYGGTAQATLDSAGNLGLGVTPSAWRSNTPAFQIGSAGVCLFADSGIAADLGNNTFLNASSQYIYLRTDAASRYRQYQGIHSWLSAASGTAGTAASFSTSMTLDTNGCLGVGTTSPSTYAQLAVRGYRTTGGVNYSGLFSDAVNSSLYIGHTSTTVNLLSDTAITFATGGSPSSFTERARIDSSGNLLVGKTAAGAANTGFQVSSVGELVVSNSATTNAGATQLNVYSTGASAYRFFVGMGGTVYATSTTITAISDQRLKENIRDLDDGLDVVMALKPRKFDWKEGKGQDIKNARGFIAQEFEQVLPDMVEEWKDPAPEGEDPYKAINANLIPTLVKAIQELKAEFDAYKATHP